MSNELATTVRSIMSSLTAADVALMSDPDWSKIKTCNRCDRDLSYALFYRNKANTSSGRLGHCKECDNQIKKGRDPQRIFVYKLNQKYNLTLEQYQQMLAQQGGACAICATTTPSGRGTWHVDHDHACCPEKGKSCGACIRGLLCHHCNVSLGGFKDDVGLLRRAAEYLAGGVAA